MRRKDKTEIMESQSCFDEISLGEIAETENFIKDRKLLERQITKGMMQAENPDYHQRLLDLNPQNYAELSDIKWLFNNNRLRCSEELSDVASLVAYYPTHKKKKAKSISWWLFFYIFLFIDCFAFSFLPRAGGRFWFADAIATPIALVGETFIPDYKEKMDGNFTLPMVEYDEYKGWYWGKEYAELPNYTSIHEVEGAEKIAVFFVFLFEFVLRVCCGVFQIIVFPLFIGLFWSLIFAMVPFIAHCLHCVALSTVISKGRKETQDVNEYYENLLKQYEAPDKLNFEDCSVNNVLTPFLASYIERTEYEAPHRTIKQKVVLFATRWFWISILLIPPLLYFSGYQPFQ